MTYWKEWGAYLTTSIESGTDVKNGAEPVWNRIESDFLPNLPYYGGGLGAIQITSCNFEMLLDMFKNSVDFSSISGTTLYNDLKNSTPSKEYKVGWSSNYAPFTLQEKQGLDNILMQKKAIEIQRRWIVKFFDEYNAQYINMIKDANIPDEVRCFVMNAVVLSPAYIPTLVTTAPVSTTVNGMADDQMQGLPEGYAGRVYGIRDLVNTMNIDFKSPPPHNFWDESSKPSGPQSPTNTGNGNNKNPSPVKPNNSVGTDVTLKKGYYILTPDNVLGGNLKESFVRFRDGLFFPGGEKQESPKKPTSGNSNPQNPDNNNPNATTPPASPNSPNKAEYKAILDGVLGHVQGDGQCYSLAKWWISQLGGDGSAMTGHMNAKSIPTDYPWGTGGGWWNNFSSGVGVPPDGWKVGDLVCFDGPLQPYGHVGICYETDGKTFLHIVDQWCIPNALGNTSPPEVWDTADGYGALNVYQYLHLYGNGFSGWVRKK